MTLIQNKKDVSVTFDHLSSLGDPESLGRFHKPQRFDLIIDTLQKTAARYDFEVEQNEMILTRGEKILMGLMSLTENKKSQINGLDSKIALGYMASAHSLTALKCVAGAVVTICSNMVLAGEMFVVSKKFTLNLDLDKAIDDGFHKFMAQRNNNEKRFDTLRTRALNGIEAKAMIHDAIVTHGLPLGLIRDVHRWYFGEDNAFSTVPEDCASRSEWGLHNAFTRSLKEYPVQAKIEHTQTVARMFGF